MSSSEADSRSARARSQTCPGRRLRDRASILHRNEHVTLLDTAHTADDRLHEADNRVAAGEAWLTWLERGY